MLEHTQLIGHYQILKLLWQDEFSKVYLGEQRII